MYRPVFAAAFGALLATAAHAQAPAAAPKPAFMRVEGTVSALTADKLTVADKDGKTTVYALAPTWYVVTVKPVDIDSIKPGSFVATANMDQIDGTGKALELRLFEPGSKLGEGSKPMDKAGKTMTNATVTRISKGAGGRELDVAYPGGVRHIVVPPDIQVIASFPAERTAVKPGMMIQSFAVPGDNDVMTVSRISVHATVPSPPK